MGSRIHIAPMELTKSLCFRFYKHVAPTELIISFFFFPQNIPEPHIPFPPKNRTPDQTAVEIRTVRILRIKDDRGLFKIADVFNACIQFKTLVEDPCQLRIE